MKEEYVEKIKENNEKINELKEDLLKYFNRKIGETKYEFNDSYSEEQLNDLLEKQFEELNELHAIFDMEDQATKYKNIKKVEEMKKDEKDPEFSKFYRTGIITINNTDIYLDKFYIKEMKNNEGRVILNLVCTDPRVHNEEDGEYNEILNIYPLKNISALYNIYLDKELYSNNKILLNSADSVEKFKNYINKWDKKNQYMVAETIYTKKV